MRALRNDPKHSGPQRRAQLSFLGCTAFVCVRTLLVIILPFYAECDCKECLPKGDVIVVMKNQTSAAAIVAIR